LDRWSVSVLHYVGDGLFPIKGAVNLVWYKFRNPTSSEAVEVSSEFGDRKEQKMELESQK
jgi:hypothetical protein